MPRDLVIGIDSSTSATKAIAWDRQGRVIAEGRAAIAMSNPHPGWFEQDPGEWWSSTVAALQQVTGQIDAARIAAIGISNQRETFGVFTEDGTALRPGMVWLDERARAQEKQFGARFGAERLHKISGKPLDITPCLHRMVWLREIEPAVLGRGERIAEVHGYLTFKLTGEWATSMASADPMGVLDMEHRDWSADILGAAGIDLGMMLRLVAPGAQSGEVSAAAAAATGLKAGTPVIAGGGDGQCAGTGAGVSADHPGRAYVNLGTALVSGSYGRAYAHDRAFRTEIAIADEGYIFETCLRSGTFLVDWLSRELFRAEPGKQKELLSALETEASTSPIGARGVVVVPYWQGCMTPYWDSAARGVIAGLSGSTRRGDIYRAFLEAIALEQATCSRDVEQATGTDIDHFVAIGGGAASDLWVQILADATGRAVQRSETVEASSLGAAIAAAKGAGWHKTIAEAAEAMAGRPIRTFVPDEKRHARYEALRAIHADLWPKVAEWNTRLVNFADQA
ncbi:FGGY-family carbohydrate kinase [Dongia sedimenti]|uniref:FGGY-family carbohydrate kinase n=1 Tax=Dongia sedimenti TaxID=3064282 RepID=A0ABU0YVH3_9PROT|nr:FGGY-family carbohydrate kinase [Rhodospirillaceae bacterium R-7]